MEPKWVARIDGLDGEASTFLAVRDAPVDLRHRLDVEDVLALASHVAKGVEARDRARARAEREAAIATHLWGSGWGASW